LERISTPPGSLDADGLERCDKPGDVLVALSTKTAIVAGVFEEGSPYFRIRVIEFYPENLIGGDAWSSTI
jgi:hypothetical protein